MDTSPEDITSWLARETGHVPEADEGYTEDSETKAPGRLGLSDPHKDKMRKFFDGLHLEKALTDKRRESSVTAVDEAEEMNEQLRKLTGGLA
jgi:hypothetical protein